MNTTKRVSVEISRIISGLALSSNLGLDQFYHELAIDREAPMTIEQFERCIEWLMVEGGKPWLGLEFGTLNITQFGILGILAGTARSLSEALQIGEQYHMLLHPLIGISVNFEGNNIIVRYSVDGEMPLLPFYAEAFMSGFFSWYTHFTGRSLSSIVKVISFRHAEPIYSEKYRDLFNCKILYNQTFDEITVENVNLNLPLQTSSPLFHADLKQQASQNRERIESFSGAVKRVIRSSLSEDAPLEYVVKQLHVSERNAQRKLREEKTSFNTLKQEVRKEEAIRLLETTPLNIEQIAFQLGYEQRSSFAAAFQRWTGKNPTQWRNR